MDFLKGGDSLVESTKEIASNTNAGSVTAVPTMSSGSEGVYVNLPQKPIHSDFVLKRLFKKLYSAIVVQAAESDIPDRHVSSLIAYLISPFALLCMGMAIILNRTVVFATTRRPSELPFIYRLMLRSIAIYALASQMVPLFKALKCTSSWAGPYIPVDVSDKGGCPKPPILWDLYRSICTGHFVETFCSVVQGRMPYSETGMTLFEYSVAFQEVQSSRKLEEEILVTSLISATSQLILHIQGIFNSVKFRLIPSTIFGLTYLSYFGYSVYRGRLLFFPTVCVIGYVPQLVILVIVFICGAIYGLACLFVGPNNMQTSIRSVHIETSDDFYSSLMKLGVLALTSVTKATYLTEASSISAPLSTWIEYIDREEGRSSTPAPYLNEVTAPPVDRPAIGPRGFLTLNRVISAMRMVQVLFAIGLYAVWSGFRQVFYYIVSRLLPSKLFNMIKFNPTTDSEPETVEFVSNLESRIIYADLDNNYEEAYVKLLSGDILPDIDNSIDYTPSDSDDEGNEYEYESNYTSEAEEMADELRDADSSSSSNLRLTHLSEEGARRRFNFDSTSSTSSLSTMRSIRNSVNNKSAQSTSPINDMFDYLLSLFTPQTTDEEEESKILSAHLSSGRITRSKYQKKDDANDILKIIMERRKENIPPELRESLCVVCHAAPRQVVLWPCRCFALCEDCRMALAVKHFKGCVCCRREVSSFSRIFVP